MRRLAHQTTASVGGCVHKLWLHSLLVATKDALIRVRLTRQEKAELEARCLRDSVGVSEYVRALIRENSEVEPLSNQVEPVKLARVGLCIHRVPAGQYCKRCD